MRNKMLLFSLGSRDCISRAAVSGFTLIEIMVVVAIIAILTAIAVPSYQDYILRSRLVDPTNQLTAMRARMEQYFQDNRFYTTGGAIGTWPCSSAERTKVNATLSPTGFTIDCTPAPTATTYRLTATGSGATAGFVFTIDQDDNKATTTTAPASTRGYPSSTTCFVMKKTGC